MIVFFPVLVVLRLLTPAYELAEVLKTFTPHLDADTRLEYSFYMVAAARKYRVDEYAVAAISLHESRMKNMPRNRTDDYGVMQVHWQKVDCLEGLTRKDLMDPRTNIYAGVCEMAYWKRYHGTKAERRAWKKWKEKRARPADQEMIDHKWFGHYKSGNVVPSKRYGNAIQKRLDRLKRRKNKLHRSRQNSTS